MQKMEIEVSDRWYPVGFDPYIKKTDRGYVLRIPSDFEAQVKLLAEAFYFCDELQFSGATELDENGKPYLPKGARPVVPGMGSLPSRVIFALLDSWNEPEFRAWIEHEETSHWQYRIGNAELHGAPAKLAAMLPFMREHDALWETLWNIYGTPQNG